MDLPKYCDAGPDLAPPLPLEAVDQFAKAIFATASPSVTEVYSDPERELRRFAKPEEIREFASVQAARRGGSVFLALHFPDTGGEARIRRIALNPQKARGATYRYCVDGWGLVWVYLAVGTPVSVISYVSANPEARAYAYAEVSQDREPVADWDWASVARHCRRIRSVLRRLQASLPR